MTMLKNLLSNVLSAEDMDYLSEIGEQLQMMAVISEADLFIDVPIDENVMMVADQAGPGDGKSVYVRNIVGEMALRENEPAVFHTLEMGVPVNDIRAVTQENRTVRQNTAPIRNKSGKVIAVLVREKDISDEIRQEKKYEELAKKQADTALSAVSEESSDALQLREMHHRVKNSLQLVASILNMQARKTKDPETKTLLQEDVSRVLSISAIHDILTTNNKKNFLVTSSDLLENLRRNLLPLIPPGKTIGFRVEADEEEWKADTASAVAMVVNELVTNAFLHAFENRMEGQVVVSFKRGILLDTVTVCDDGNGFSTDCLPKDSFGLSIVKATVHDKLNGSVRIQSGPDGTKVSFDFKA